MSLRLWFMCLMSLDELRLAINYLSHQLHAGYSSPHYISANQQYFSNILSCKINHDSQSIIMRRRIAILKLHSSQQLCMRWSIVFGVVFLYKSTGLQTQLPCLACVVRNIFFSGIFITSSFLIEKILSFTCSLHCDDDDPVMLIELLNGDAATSKLERDRCDWWIHFSAESQSHVLIWPCAVSIHLLLVNMPNSFYRSISISNVKRKKCRETNF